MIHHPVVPLGHVDQAVRPTVLAVTTATRSAPTIEITDDDFATSHDGVMSRRMGARLVSYGASRPRPRPGVTFIEP